MSGRADTMGRAAPARYRFGIALAALFALQLAVIGAFFLFLALDMDEAQRALLLQALAQHAALLGALGLLLLLALGAGLRALLKAYLAPVEALADDARLLASNPAHRATPQGAWELRVLAEKFNALADAHQSLQLGVQSRIAAASRALAEEKNRLAALMAELTQCVLACNVEGRILLYNSRARELLEAGRDGAPGNAAVGLGRSIFALLDRGLVVHALEHIQYQLATVATAATAATSEGRHPVSRFVAALADDRMVRASMAPVLDEGNALVGFVLTLEDITRDIEAGSRRDALLQALTAGTRAALANIRAALETMQAFPEMSEAKRAQFIEVIDEESRRLMRQIEGDASRDSMESQSQMEEMRAADLLGLMLRQMDGNPLRARPLGEVDDTLWLKADSYALTQAFAALARKLHEETGTREVALGIAREGRLAHLDLAWNGAAPDAETMRAWENAAIPSAGGAMTVAGVIARHGGDSVYRPEQARYRMLLPASEPRPQFALPPRRQGRPEYYDFDLFHQPGQTEELDRRALQQLIYTVFDTETTGLLAAEGDEIVSIGALRIVNGRLLQQENFEQLVRPRRPLPPESTAIHGITEAMLKDQPPIEQVLPRFFRFAEDTVLVAHNAAFDMRFLQMQEERCGVRFTQPVLDTLLLSQVIHPKQPQHSLEAIAERFGVPVIGRHTALGDAIVTGEVFLRMLPLLAEQGILTLGDAREAARQTLYARIHY